MLGANSNTREDHSSGVVESDEVNVVHSSLCFLCAQQLKKISFYTSFIDIKWGKLSDDSRGNSILSSSAAVPVLTPQTEVVPSVREGRP